MIIDLHGRAWRLGTVGTTIGLSGLPGLVDLRGRTGFVWLSFEDYPGRGSG